MVPVGTMGVAGWRGSSPEAPRRMVACWFHLATPYARTRRRPPKCARQLTRHKYGDSTRLRPTQRANYDHGRSRHSEADRRAGGARESGDLRVHDIDTLIPSSSTRCACLGCAAGDTAWLDFASSRFAVADSRAWEWGAVSGRRIGSCGNPPLWTRPLPGICEHYVRSDGRARPVSAGHVLGSWRQAGL